MNDFKPIEKSRFSTLIEKYRKIQSDFLYAFGVDDIFSNSKIYEIVIANELGHNLIPGHSGSKDAKDDSGRIYEYKHYKETSSNHTWTFNDFSDTTIEKLNSCDYVIFAHIADGQFPELFDWYYKVAGKTVSIFLLEATKKLRGSGLHPSQTLLQEKYKKSAQELLFCLVGGKRRRWVIW